MLQLCKVCEKFFEVENSNICPNCGSIDTISLSAILNKKPVEQIHPNLSRDLI